MIRVLPLLLFLLLIAAFGCSISGCAESRSVPSAEEVLPSGTALSFTDVTDQAGLGSFRHETGAFGKKWFPETMGSGGGFLDYNGDGWLDVLLVGGGSWPAYSDRGLVPALRLYRSNGDGTFTEVTTETGLGGISGYGIGITVADYDNDGDEDVFFTTLDQNMLFRNDGDHFTEVAEQAGVVGPATWSSSALFFDANRDGHLDLFVGNYVDWSPEKDIWCSISGQKGYCTPEEYQGVPSRFYRNNGDGTFTDRTEVAGFGGSPGKTLGMAELDYNRDGWPDLVVANDLEPDLLYRNRGDGTFEEVGVISGIAFDEHGRARAGMGIDTGVVDSTGEETIFVGNFSNEMIGVYRHMRDGLFIDRAAISQIGRPSLKTLTFGLFLFDIDLDTDLDLFAANGHVKQEIEAVQDGVTYREPPHLFINAGDGTFEDRAPAIGGVLAEPIVARGAAYGDYDRDGDLDILITENNGPVHLWRNDTEGGHFLRVRLEGRESSRDGLGARIVAYVDGLAMERRIRTGSSYLSQSEKTATFGLGRAERIDSLVVYWPSGRVERFEEVAGGREIRLKEGVQAYTEAERPA